MRTGRWAALFWTWLVLALPAVAGDSRFSVLLDTDNSAATGCTLSTANGAASGIEQVATTVVTTSTSGAMVTRLERQACANGTLGTAVAYDGGGWAVGLGNGTGGAAAVETSIPLTLLPASGTMKALVTATAGAGQDATAPFLIALAPATTIPVVPVPLSPWLVLPLSLFLLGVVAWWHRRHSGQTGSLVLLILVAGTGLVWAASVLRDGNVGDWAGVTPAVTDAAGDAPIDADVVAVFTQQDGANLYLRIDADVRKDATTNQSPSVSAGSNQSVTLPATANLTGSATDDGLPNPPAALTTAWSKVSGPGTVNFANAAALSTAATFGAAGSYVLRLTASDSVLASSADVTITVNPASGVNQAPQVNAGANQSVTLPAMVNLSGSATDDGLPNPPAALTYAWMKVSGPGTVIFGNAANAVTSASFGAAGSYLLRLTASDSALAGTADVTITVNDTAPVGPQIAPIADQTIALGARFQQLVQATAPNINEVLTFALPTAPPGAALSPAPLIDWLPTAAQVGVNAFTAKVTDGQGQTATATFKVTVTHVNQPPQLQPQANATVNIGGTFSRTLVATDPDAGDTLTYSLVTGPSGMTLTGASLNWPTTGYSVGDYAASVKVTDGGGLSDVKPFTLSLRQAVAPVANDDHYEVNLGQSLTIPAPGVLGNDLDPMGAGLTAAKLTGPDKGTLSVFNADGSFTYQAPAVIGKTFQPVVKWISHSDIPGMSAFGNIFAVDVDGDGKPEIVTNQPAANLWGAVGISVIRGTDGTLLWGSTELQLPPSPSNAAPLYCTIATRFNTPDGMAVGDIDDSGTPAIVVPLSCPGGPNGSYPPGTPQSSRLAALDMRTGALKWISEELGYLHNGVTTNQLMWYVVPAIARLKAGESPTVLFKKTIGGYWGSAAAGETYCNDFKPGTGAECTVVIGVDGATGLKRRTWVAPADSGASTYGPRGGFVAVADITGSGSPNIVADAAVWDVDGNVVSNRRNGRLVLSTALANLDDSGQVAIISHEVGIGSRGWVVARKPNGTVLWESPSDDTAVSVSGEIVVGDLFGDGRPKVLVTTHDRLYVYDERGAVVWTHRFVRAFDGYAGLTGWERPVVFDLDGDGVPEVIVQTVEDVQFFDGKTGARKGKVSFEDIGYPKYSSYPYALNSKTTTPLVIDSDGDGRAEVVFQIISPSYPANSWVVTLKSATDPWQPARPVWNQFAMHDANVTDSGHIPFPEAANFATARTNVFANPARIAPPVDPRKREQATFAYKAQAGGFDSNAATVTIDLIPPNRPPVFTSVAPTAYMPYSAYNAGNPYVPFVYNAHATDPDPGDTLTYSIAVRGGPEAYNFVIDPATGRVSVQGNILYGSIYDGGVEDLVIAATDSFGESVYQTLKLIPSTGPIVVPGVVGMSKAEADAALAAAGFATGTVGAVYSAAPVDQVLTQFPAAGARVLKGEAIALQVSLGPQPVPLPNLVGLSLTAAQTQLTGLGFTVIVNAVSSSTVPASQVFGQSPAFGTELTPLPGNPVTLTTSIGPPLTGTVAQVIVEPAPSATRIVGETVAYRATAVYTDGTSTDVTLRSLWNTGTPAVASVNGTGSAHALTAGATTISATAGGKTGQATLNVVERAAGDATMPVAAMTAPADGATMTGPTAIIGTANDANFLRYELAYAPAGETTWTVIGEGTSPVTAGTLGTFDPTTLLNDLYTLRLTVFDRGGNETESTSTVQVSGGRKIGMFSLAFIDLAVPVAGIPITVTRTYDSRDKAKGDFGIGWRLDMKTLRLRANRLPGTGWVRVNSGATVSLKPTAEHKVSITLPDGKVEEFDLVVSPMSGFGGLDATVVTGYAARSGTLGKLEALGNLNLLILNGGLEDELVDDTTLNTFEPSLYRYTTLDGTQFEIHRTQGVKKLTDTNGNSVSIGPAGIIHSSGKSVAFARDGQGRITQITDPAGNVQAYAYDANGDLVGHTTATGDTSRYAYDRQHNLIDVRNALGTQVTRNDYDASGRLIAITDAKGNKITYTHNIGTSTELVIDRRGSATLFSYDAMGNVLAKTDPLGHVTTYTYDTRNNQLSQTDPLGRTTVFVYDANSNVTSQTDPLGNTTSFTYDSRGQVLTVTDPLGRISANTYDARGNLLTQTDPLGNTTSITYDASGNPLALTDSLGRVTHNEYNSAGSRTKLTQPGGNVLAFSYDGNGNLLSQANALSPTWRLSYDPMNRITSAVMGDVARSVNYDADGLPAGVTTASGQQGQFFHDPIGLLSQFIRPGNATNTATISLTYDAEGNVLTETDALGNITAYTYDAAGRRIATTFSDGAMEQRDFDAAGQLVRVIDRAGRATTYQYDNAGRQIQTANALGDVTRRGYDAIGNVVALTDALGHTTRYTYDLANRSTITTYPDSSTELRTYDGAGQLLAIIDPAGHRTTFAYSDAGALTAVTDALGNTTRYEYDPAGKRTAVVDANGNRTSFAYDSQGRLIKTTYPLGDSETAVYDIAGRPVITTDGNGVMLMYSYDTWGQLSSLTLPNGTIERYFYTTDGLIDAVVDARGTTRHQYDPANRRLTRVTEPDGRYVRYEYDVAGNRTLAVHAMTNAASEEATRYGYDALNRLVEVTDPSGGITRYTYDAVGNQTAINRPNGTSTTFAYDTRNRLTNEVHRNSVGTTLASFTYSLDAVGNRTTVHHHDNSRIEYDYDATNKVTAERHTNASNVLTDSIAYNYDAAGNLISRTGSLGNATYTYNPNHQLTAGNGFSYDYDGAGNVVSATSGASAATRYAYDPLGRLTQFQPPVGPATTYAYDFRGLRQSKSGPGGTINFLTDRANATGFPQVVRESDTVGTTLRTYSYGLGLLARTQGGSASYYHADGLGSTRLLTDSGGAPTNTYTYSAYGQLLGGANTSANAYRFAGEQEDAESGLYYLRARYYDPKVGRFLSRDSAAGSDLIPLSRHKYLYAHGNPANYTDPSGLSSLADVTATMKQIGTLLRIQVPQLYKAKRTAEGVAAKVEMTTAVALSIVALVESFVSPVIAQTFYGPPPTQYAGQFVLARTVWDMATRNTSFIFALFGPSGKPSYAFVLPPGSDYLVWKATQPAPARDAYVYFTPRFFLLPPLPTWQSLLLTMSQPGTILHEFVHVTTGWDDVFYNCNILAAMANPVGLGKGILAVAKGDSSGFSNQADDLISVGGAFQLAGGLLAVKNPDNHRCFVEASYLGTMTLGKLRNLRP